MKYCPNCGSKKIIDMGNEGINGGELFISEETKNSFDCYDLITSFKCSECSCNFYVSMIEDCSGSCPCIVNN